MTRLDNRDPLPPREWQPVSHDWARRECLQRTREAIAAAKDSRKKPKTDNEETAP